jgi:hypothetical protein
MQKIEPAHGIILEVLGQTPGPAAGIRYRVRWYTESGSWEAVCSPTGQRWGSPLHVRAFPVDTCVRGFVVGGRLQWSDREIADHGECAPAP